MVSVTVIKSILLVVMAVVTMIAVLLPLGVLKIPRVKNSNSDRRKFILSILNCFGGGVFIATGKFACCRYSVWSASSELGYLHLLTDSKEKMDEAIEDVLHKEVEYPFTQFVVCVGFLLVLIIENIAVSCKSADQDEVLEQIAPLHSSIRIVNSCRVSTGEYDLYSYCRRLKLMLWPPTKCIVIKGIARGIGWFGH